MPELNCFHVLNRFLNNKDLRSAAFIDSRSAALDLKVGWGGVLWDKISYLLSSLEMYTS